MNYFNRRFNTDIFERENNINTGNNSSQLYNSSISSSEHSSINSFSDDSNLTPSSLSNRTNSINNGSEGNYITNRNIFETNDGKKRYVDFLLIDYFDSDRFYRSKISQPSPYRDDIIDQLRNISLNNNNNNTNNNDNEEEEIENNTASTVVLNTNGTGSTSTFSSNNNTTSTIQNATYEEFDYKIKNISDIENYLNKIKIIREYIQDISNNIKQTNIFFYNDNKNTVLSFLNYLNNVENIYRRRKDIELSRML